jgi:pimeloyl-ACP methyl ester carboxylesterase
VVPDLRGMGLSSHPANGYDKRTQAADIAGVLDTLGVDRAAMVAHDIGNMVAFAFAARYPERLTKLVLMDAPVPGIANWDELSHVPQTWHFYFYGPLMATIARAAFTTVSEGVIANAGHWLMEEQPDAVVAGVRPFLT